MKLDLFRHEFCNRRGVDSEDRDFQSTLHLAAARIKRYEGRGCTIVGDRPPTSWTVTLPPEDWGMDKKNDNERIIRDRERIVKTLGFRALWYGTNSIHQYTVFDVRGFHQGLKIFNEEGQRIMPQYV